MAITSAHLICSGIFCSVFFTILLLAYSSQVSFILATSNNSDLEPDCDKNNMTGTDIEMNTLQDKVLSIRGLLDLSSSKLELMPSMILPSSEFTPIPPNRTFTINLVDKDMNELGIFPFNLIISTANDSNNKSKDHALISAAVPYDSCTARVILKMNDKVLAYQTVSPHVPDIKFIKIGTDFNVDEEDSMLFPRAANITVDWDAGDLDGDNLTYSLLYSNDGGLTWDTVIDYTTSKSIRVPGDSFQGNTVNLSKFRLIATDNVNTDIKDSDFFSIPALTLEH